MSEKEFEKEIKKLNEAGFTFWYFGDPLKSESLKKALLNQDIKKCKRDVV